MHRPEWLRQSGYALLAGQSPTVADMRYWRVDLDSG